MVEKPISLSLQSVDRIIEAERNAPKGAKVFVGYMRRYAKSFTQTFKREVATIGKILYARSRDFSGPNAKFVDESGTFQVKNQTFPQTLERNVRSDSTLFIEKPSQIKRSLRK